MACYATGSAEGDARLAHQETLAEMQSLTRLLCELCDAWDRFVVQPPMPPNVREWWEAHQKIDEARREREARHERDRQAKAAKAQERQELINSLTPEQRELLGVS